MHLCNFLIALHQSGRVAIVDPHPPLRRDLEACREVLRGMDRAARAALAEPGPPELRFEAAVWAAVMMYRACQFLVFREIDASLVEAGLAEPCPTVEDAAGPGATCYSVDLTLRFLPDLATLARGLASDDPLVAGLERLAWAWPLSSVGLKPRQVEVEVRPGLDVSPFMGHPALRQLYIDRIIERKDASRLDHAEVRRGVAAALGLHRELCPELAAALDVKESA